MKAFVGFLVIIVKLLIVRFALAKTHHLYVGNKQFYLVISALDHLIKLSISLVEVHLHQVDKRQIVQRLSLTCAVTIRQGEGLLRIDSY